MTRHIVCLTFDFDTESGFIARGWTTPTPRSRGEFGLVGAARTLALLKERGLPSTWFIPGFTIESHPAACEVVLASGHEIAHHSWAHIPPTLQSRDEEAADIGRANDAIEKLTGRRARGYRSPSWDLSENTLELLIEENMEYDSSLMNTDYRPTRTRLNDEVELGQPIRYGLETDLIEMPISWALDDYPHFEFAHTPDITLSSLNAPRAVMEVWRDEFTYMQKTMKWGVLTYTMHPYVIGRGSRMLALEGLLDELTEAGAVFLTMEDAAREARGRMGG
ncbi:MAG: polysaccharide deacetylase [Pseudomonadota bacterium]|nr:polysaccharide deacetylase [Pseudomonadota bacterium]